VLYVFLYVKRFERVFEHIESESFFGGVDLTVQCGEPNRSFAIILFVRAFFNLIGDHFKAPHATLVQPEDPLPLVFTQYVEPTEPDIFEYVVPIGALTAFCGLPTPDSGRRGTTAVCVWPGPAAVMLTPTDVLLAGSVQVAVTVKESYVSVRLIDRVVLVVPLYVSRTTLLPEAFLIPWTTMLKADGAPTTL
jgi:hypothetical protein